MTLGPFARRRQAKKDDKELGQGLWRQAYSRFERSLDRYWQIIETDHTQPNVAPLDEAQRNGLVHAGNILAEQAAAVREICRRAREDFAEHELDVPAGAADIHRALSRASNDLAMTAQAAAMYRQNQADVETIGRRAQKVLDSVAEAQRALDQAQQTK